MNKQYIAPTTEVVVIDYEQMMLTASGEQTETGSGNAGGDGYNTDDFANQKRGSWGNLWE